MKLISLDTTEYEVTNPYLLISGCNIIDCFPTRLAAVRFAEKDGIKEYTLYTRKQYKKYLQKIKSPV